MLNKKFVLALLAGFALLSVNAHARKPDPTSKTCCSNISGWGSVFYTESCANGHMEWDGSRFYVFHCDNYATVDTWYAQGASCPSGYSCAY